MSRFLDTTDIGYINRWMQRWANSSLEQQGIPLKVELVETGQKRSIWQLHFSDEVTVRQAYELLVDKHDSLAGKPASLISRDEARFLVVAEWVVWMVVCKGRLNHPSAPELFKAMTYWMSLWKSKGGGQVN